MKKRKVLSAVMIAAGILVACASSQPADQGKAEPPADVVAAAASSEAYEIPAERNPEATKPGLDILIVFRGGNDSASLERVMSYAAEVNEQVIVDKLIEYGVLEEGTEILSFEITEEADPTSESSTESSGPMAGGSATRIGHLDLSVLPEISNENEEQILLNCIAGSFMENFALNGLELSVNGEPYSGSLLTMDMKYKNISEE